MKSILLSYTLLSVFAAVNIQAAPVPCPTSGTGPSGAPSYADLMATNAGGGCFIADKVFSSFTFLASQAGGAATLSPTNVTYTLDNNATPGGLIGFEFDLALGVL